MHPKSIGWLTPKPEPFLVSHIGGKVESALLETREYPFLGPYVRQCLIVLLDIIALWSLRPESWELAERESCGWPSLQHFQFPVGTLPLPRRPISQTRRADTHI